MALVRQLQLPDDGHPVSAQHCVSGKTDALHEDTCDDCAGAAWTLQLHPTGVVKQTGLSGVGELLHPTRRSEAATRTARTGARMRVECIVSRPGEARMNRGSWLLALGVSSLVAALTAQGCSQAYIQLPGPPPDAGGTTDATSSSSGGGDTGAMETGGDASDAGGDALPGDGGSEAGDGGGGEAGDGGGEAGDGGGEAGDSGDGG